MPTKRKSTPLPRDCELQKSPRVDRVSCLFCQARKLKCSRVSPCSNCITYGKECRFINTRLSARLMPENHQINREPCEPCREKSRKCDRKDPCGSCFNRQLECYYATEMLRPTQSDKESDQARSEVEQPGQEMDQPEPRSVQVSNRHCESCRLKKIKCDRTAVCKNCSMRGLTCRYDANAVFSNRPEPKNDQNSDRLLQETPISSSEYSWAGMPSEASHSSRLGDDHDASHTAEHLESIVMGHRLPTAIPSTSPLHASEFASDTASPLRNSKSGSLAAVIRGEDIVSDVNPLAVDLSTYLPTEAEAIGLLQFYHDHLSYQYHIIIYSFTKQQFQNIYQNASQGTDLNMSEVALLFSIVASSLFFKLLSSESADAAEKSSSEVAFLAAAALLQGNYPSRPTTSGLQAALIIGHYLSKATLSPWINSLFLHTTSLGQARSLGLHLLDSGSAVAQRRATGYDKVELELKRRLWWDIASYDWLIGFLSGPQEFTYTIHPRHMIVNKPLNIEDEDIESETAAPMSTPTCMSYTLSRIALAESCGVIVDKLAPYHLNNQEPPYEKILELDRYLREGYAQIPSFFRFDPASKHEHELLYRQRPSFAWQRSFVEQGWQTRICRLHRQWFIRGAKDPRFSYSHVVALQSARKVIEVKRMMDGDEPSLAPTSSSFWAIMHHVFIASVILLMDVCFNWDDVLAERRKQEVLDACRILSRAQEVSSVARDGINAMMAVMRKHWKHDKRPNLLGYQEDPMASGGILTFDQAGAITTQSADDQTEADSLEVPSTGLLGADPVALPSFDMEDAWIEMINDGGGNALETPDWMDMLSELGTLPS